jgi:hypothetical protein
LVQDKKYTGKVDAVDKKNNRTSVPFDFVTNEYKIRFNKLYTIENKNATGWSIEKTTDGGYVIGGNISYDNGGETLILKLDSLGYEQWHTICVHHLSINVRIRQTSDDGYIITDQAKLIRLNSSGKEIWRYPNDQNGQGYNSLVISPDNNYIVVRGVDDTTNGVLVKASVMKFDDNGDILWEKRYGEVKRTYADFIEKTTDGNYMILGTEGKEDALSDVQLTKIDESGNILWQKTFEKNGYEFVTQLTPTKDNGFVISGFSDGALDIASAMIIKIDQNGNEEWTKTFLWDSFKTYAYSVKQTLDGGYMFCGGNGYSPEEAILVKLDNNGNLLWGKQYSPDYSDYIWVARDMELTSDNGFIFVGIKSWIWSGDGKEVGLWVLKTNELGEKK